MPATDDDFFAGRLQLPMIRISNNKEEKLVIEFDFDDRSTGLDVITSVLEQVKDEYRLIDADASKLVMTVKDLGVSISVTSRLLSEPKVLMHFLNFKQKVASGRDQNQKPLKPPMFYVTVRTNINELERANTNTLLDSAVDVKETSFSTVVNERGVASSAHIEPTTRANESLRGGDTSQLQSTLTGVTPPTPLPLLTAEHISRDMEQEAAWLRSETLGLFGGSEAELIVPELDIDEVWLDRANTLLEDHVSRFKELRSTSLSARRHWVHLLPEQPSRDAWLQAMQKETNEYQVWVDTGLTAAVTKSQLLLNERNETLRGLESTLEPLQFDTIRAREAIRTRSGLQERLDELRKEASEFRGLEDALHQQLQEKLRMLMATRGSASERRQRADYDDAMNSNNMTTSPAWSPQQQHVLPNASTASPQFSSVQRGPSVDDTYFDEPPSSGYEADPLGVLSPTLREKVSSVLHSSDTHDAPQSERESSQSGSLAVHRGDADLRQLAQQLSQFLNTSSPDPNQRVKLLEQVRKAREVVEKKRGSLVASVSQGRDSSPRSLYPHNNVTQTRYETTSRGPSTTHRPRHVDNHKVVSPHRYDVSGRGGVPLSLSYHHGPPSNNRSVLENDDDVAALAERAVPFFRR